MYYKCTENTSLIRELDLNIVLWKQTALNGHALNLSKEAV